MHPSPHLQLIGGPNGAGKSTSASLLLPSTLEFINADEVARTLPGYPSRQADFEAARIVLDRMNQLARLRANFAVETTLASRSLAARIVRLKRSGYLIRLIYLFLPNVEIAIQRVGQRVRRGGHDIPVETIRRRYMAGIRNLFSLYLPLADKWTIVDTSGSPLCRCIAEGAGDHERYVHDLQTWQFLYDQGH